MAATRSRGAVALALAASLLPLAACSRGKKPEAAEAKGAQPGATPTPAPAARDYGFKSLEDFSKFAMFYHRAPAPDRVPDAMRYYIASPWIEDPENVLSTAVFFSEIFKRDEKAMTATFDALAADGSDDAKTFYLHSLWFVDSPASAALVARAEAEWKSEKAKAFITAMRKRSPKAFMEAPIQHLGQLDLQWMRFFATGEAEPVLRVIGIAAPDKPAAGNEKKLAEAAAWMLKSNALRHQEVRKILAEEEEKASGPRKDALREIIAEIIKEAAAQSAPKNGSSATKP